VEEVRQAKIKHCPDGHLKKPGPRKDFKRKLKGPAVLQQEAVL